jgi:hypothetical protein
MCLLHGQKGWVFMKVPVRWEGPFNEAKDDAETYCGMCDEYISDDDWKFCPKCGVELLRYDYEIEYEELCKLGVAIKNLLNYTSISFKVENQQLHDFTDEVIITNTAELLKGWYKDEN